MLASIFVVGPINTLRNSSGAAAKAEPVTDPLVRLAQRAGLPIAQDPEKLVKINAGVQLAAGLCLATGRFPRLAAAVLATTLVPTTLAGHDFWNESASAPSGTSRRWPARSAAKNLSLLGGLIIAAGDTDGRPGVAWLAKHTVGDARRELGHRTSTAKLEGKVAALEAGLGATSLGAAAIGAGQQAKEAIKGAAHQAASSDATQRLAERATELASDLAATTKKKAPIVAAATREQIATLAETAREQAKPVVAELGKQARTTGAELKKQARANAKDLRKQAAASTKDVRKQARKSGKKAAKDARKSYVKKQKELAKAARKQLGQAKATLA
jgi:uncharacterized membrane protein YphA (DoxX/SURF4 family)